MKQLSLFDDVYQPVDPDPVENTERIQYVTIHDDQPDWNWAFWDNATGWDPRYMFRSFARALKEHYGNHMSTIVGIQIDGKEWHRVDAAETLQRFAEQEAGLWLDARIADGAPDALRSYVEQKLRGDTSEEEWQAYYATPDGQIASDIQSSFLRNPYGLYPRLQWIFAGSPQHFARLWYRDVLVPEICRLFGDLPIPYGGILPFDPQYPYQLIHEAYHPIRCRDMAQVESIMRAHDPHEHLNWVVQKWESDKKPDPKKPWQW